MALYRERLEHYTRALDDVEKIIRLRDSTRDRLTAREAEEIIARVRSQVDEGDD